MVFTVTPWQCVFQDNKTEKLEQLEIKLGEAVLRELPPINRGLSFLKISAAVAPLLGLLGTVTGMIITFQAITLFGAGDPKLMAGGISQALVTTVLGLVVAIPTLLASAEGSFSEMEAQPAIPAWWDRLNHSECLKLLAHFDEGRDTQKSTLHRGGGGTPGGF